MRVYESPVTSILGRNSRPAAVGINLALHLVDTSGDDGVAGCWIHIDRIMDPAATSSTLAEEDV